MSATYHVSHVRCIGLKNFGIATILAVRSITAVINRPQITD